MARGKSSSILIAQLVIATISSMISLPWKCTIISHMCLSGKEPLKDCFHFNPSRMSLRTCWPSGGIEGIMEEQTEWELKRPNASAAAAANQVFNHQSDGSEWVQCQLDDPTALVTRINLSEMGPTFLAVLMPKKRLMCAILGQLANLLLVFTIKNEPSNAVQHYSSTRWTSWLNLYINSYFHLL